MGQYYPHLKIPGKCRLGKCDRCVDFIYNIFAPSTKLIQEKWRQKYNEYLNEVRCERLHKMMIDSKSSHQPHQYMSITTDFKSSIRMPHFAILQKSMFVKQRPKLEVQGLINYGIGTFQYTTFLPYGRHTANLNASIIFQHLHLI